MSKKKKQAEAVQKEEQTQKTEDAVVTTAKAPDAKEVSDVKEEAPPEIVSDSRYESDKTSVEVMKFDLTTKKGTQSQAARVISSVLMRQYAKTNNVPVTKTQFNAQDICDFIKGRSGVSIEPIYASGHPARSAFYRLTCVGKGTMEKEGKEGATKNTYGIEGRALEDVGRIALKGAGHYAPHRKLTKVGFDKIFPEYDEPTINRACDVMALKIDKWSD